VRGQVPRTPIKKESRKMMIYVNDHKSYFPTCYSYVDGNGSGNGYYHWTAIIIPDDYTAAVTAGKYPRVAGEYVNPSHTPGGWAPSNFIVNRIPSPPLSAGA
jgi:hypothetical protein